MPKMVVVRSTTRADYGACLWSSPVTGQPLLEYVPAAAFHLEEAGEVTIKIEGDDD